MSSANVVPDALILEKDASVMVGTTLRAWKAGDMITDKADIARLESANVPRKRYELIPDQPTPTPRAKKRELEVAA